MKRNSLFLVILMAAHLFPSPACAGENWLCKEESSQRRGNSVLSCGVGFGNDENQARLSAFDNSKTEFNRVCNSSTDCKGHEITTEPKRTSCEQEGTKYKCYRLIVYIIGTAKAASGGTNHSSSLSARDKPETFAPFVYESIKNKPKVHKGMSKKEVLAAFGAPETAENGMFGFEMRYRGKMCVDEFCFVTFSGNSVSLYSGFKPIYTEDLADAPTQPTQQKSVNRAKASSPREVLPDFDSLPDDNAPPVQENAGWQQVTTVPSDGR